MPAGEVEQHEVRASEALINERNLVGDGHPAKVVEASAMVEVPLCFVDPMPLRGAWHQPAKGPPYEAVQLLFADCRTAHGTWCPTDGSTGVWWGWCEIERKFTALSPIGWRAMEPSHSG
jgi:hypothetical protein